ncbi:lachesin-like [Chrysoperla carnea]|uniref:lachesin-like n=1 Tax=Chrysoperla carnea TaxID=189513 RepID=UPI001D0819C2|nr:lachesin-like [Chrysoperla carnea]
MILYETDCPYPERLLWCIAVLVTLVAGQLAPLEELEPEFLAPLENHTVTQGRDVYFTCVVNHLSSYKVAWIKSDSKAILAIHTHMVAHNPRLSVTHNGHNTWKLHVSNVQKNDSGTYMCQINTDPMRSQMGNLEVVIPPDIIDEDDMVSSIDGNTATEGGSVRLRCHATGVPEPTVLWRREDNRNIVFRHEGGREKQALWSYDGDTLHLTNIQRADMGAYLCIASNGIPPSVSKRFTVQVHFHPLIKVSNQLVAAPMESDVLIQCYVETSPRALNSWYKDTGEKLMEGSKYVMQEFMLNDYSLLMNLTIRSLEQRDFGGYICSSENALGKAEGVVRLQELHLPSKTTTTQPPPRFIDVFPKSRIKPSANVNSSNSNKTRKKQRQPGQKGRHGNNDYEDDLPAIITTQSVWPIDDVRTIKYDNTNPQTNPPWVTLVEGSAEPINQFIIIQSLPLLVALNQFTK